MNYLKYLNKQTYNKKLRNRYLFFKKMKKNILIRYNC